MAKGISISIASDTREFAKGVQTGIVAPLEDADDAVKDIGRDASRLGELEDNMTAAQKATHKYEGELQDAIDAQKKAARGARDLGDDARDGFKGAGGAASEFKDEALSNFSEVTSSFDGSMTSVVDLAQGTLGGLASLGGPLGLALGGLAAVLGGAFAGLATSADENAQEATERVQKMYADMIESGNKFVSEDLIRQSIQDLIEDEGKLATARENAARAGISVQTELRAEAGDREALNTALDAAQEKYAAVRDRVDEVVRNGGTVSGQLSAESSAAHDLVQRYTDLIASQDTAASKADLFAQATSATSAAMADSRTKADQLRGTLDAFHDVNVKVNVDDAVAQEHLRQLGKAINVDMYVTPRTGRGIN